MRTKVFIAICILLSLLVVGNAQAQTTHTYKGKTYQVQTGAKGGKYFIVDGTKHYLAAEIKVVNGQGQYKGKLYPIQEGPKGGKYIVVGTTKHYLPREP